jgi:hypothetical protein
MNNKETVTQADLMTIIEDFITKSAGLSFSKGFDGAISIFQKSDAKTIEVRRSDLVEVLARKDAEGKEFVQVNLSTGKKILLTESLVGFKPQPVADLDVTKLPKVVTTVDLVSVLEAIEESSSSEQPSTGDTEMLKKVFNSILLGGEEVGFDLSKERSWLRRLPTIITKASA